MSGVSEYIWTRDVDGTGSQHPCWQYDDGAVGWVRLDLFEAAVAAARAEGWASAIEAVKVEINEWLALPAVPPKNPRAEVYDEACRNIMRFVCDLKPSAEASK